MQVLNSNDYKMFKSLVKLKQNEMKKLLHSYLKKKYDEVIKSEKYIYAKGEIPIALVAHMDTVFNTPPKNIFYDENQGVIWSPEGLGADDRAGIFAIIKILQSGLRPSIIFTADEEIGALGASELITDYPEPIEDLKYIIQLDRRGTNDCVFYDCDNKEFVDYVESFGFIENFGSFSDISEICPQWKVAGVNLSIGYENEHSYIETLHVKPMIATIGKVKAMLQELAIPKFEYIPDKRWSYSSLAFGYNNPYMVSYLDDDDRRCEKCGYIFSESEMIPIRTKKKTKYYCPDCCVDGVGWCEECGEPFEKQKNSKIKYCGGKKCKSTK